MTEQYEDEIFDRVSESERENVLAIYHSMVGTAGCTWNMEYPDEHEIAADLARGELFCIRGREGILGVISVDRDEAVSALPQWDALAKKPAELARLAVIHSYQNRGLARRLILSTVEILKQQEYDTVRYLVSPGNKKALASYAKLNFEYRGSAFLYEQEWFLYEQAIERIKEV